MKNNYPNDRPQKIYQLLECMILNFIGLYVDAYLGFGLSLILLLWNWQKRVGDRS